MPAQWLTARSQWAAGEKMCRLPPGQWAFALRLLDEMRERGVEPNVVTYNAAISACKKGAQW